MQYGFIRAAAATPNIKVGDCQFNKHAILRLMEKAVKQNVHILVFSELTISGYTAADLFLHDTLLSDAKVALLDIIRGSKGKNMLLAVGVPLEYRGRLMNCAAVIFEGRLLGVVPKTHIPNYGEFYELRYFTPADADMGTIAIGEYTAPFGTKQVFTSKTLQGLRIGVEICEDLWVAHPPSASLAQAGAAVILNLSASSEMAGKDIYRKELVAGQSARLHCAYVYADAGFGESTTDCVFAGHNIIAENGVVLEESIPFAQDEAFVVTELNISHLLYERRRRNTFGSAQEHYMENGFAYQHETLHLKRRIDPSPFIPKTQDACKKRCEHVLNIQAHGLYKRLAHIGGGSAVIGISGGLDSTLALLVTVRAMALLKKSPEDIVAVTMPCFGTTTHTRDNAKLLCECLNVPCREIDITDSVKQHFADIRQPEDKYDVVYENAQARERTQVLMDIANQCGGIVIGTGDLSEMALGFTTYNGDHMSMYAVNASVPKTLLRHIVRYAADTADTQALKDVLLSILDTPISPELLPARDGEIAQITERLVGPYALHDFFLYHMLRWGEEPKKILYLAKHAFADQYDEKTIAHWLKLFIRRFFSQQFKRSCMPDGPKIGSVSLSPRSDWRMPSDASAAAWLDQLD